MSPRKIFIVSSAAVQQRQQRSRQQHRSLEDSDDRVKIALRSDVIVTSTHQYCVLGSFLGEKTEQDYQKELLS
jgi:hypothetical protein